MRRAEGHAFYAVYPEAYLVAAQAAREADGGIDIAERFMRMFMRQPIGSGEVLQLEAGGAVLATRPFQTLWSQGVPEPHLVCNVAPKPWKDAHAVHSLRGGGHSEEYLWFETTKDLGVSIGS